MNTSDLTTILYNITPDYVHSVSYGFKTTNNTQTPNKAIIFGVIKKNPIESIPKNELIPKTLVINGEIYLTDVEEIRECADVCSSTIGQACGPADIENIQNKQYTRPLQGGVSIGSNDRMECTLGLFMVDQHDGSLVGISTAHSLVPNPFWNYDKYGLTNTKESSFTDFTKYVSPRLTAELASKENNLYGFPIETITNREKLILKQEENIENIEIFQPSPKYGNNPENSIGYLKRYFPISGLNLGYEVQSVSALRQIFNVDPGWLLPDAEDPLLLSTDVAFYQNNSSIIDPDKTIQENLDLIYVYLNNFSVPTMGLTNSTPLGTDTTSLAQFSPDNPTWGQPNTSRFGNGASRIGKQYINYVDAAVIAINTKHPDFAKQLGSSVSSYPIATTFEIETQLLGAKLFINGAAKGFRGSDDINADCAIICEGLNGTVQFDYPNPYYDENFSKSGQSLAGWGTDYNDVISRSRFAWKSFTKNLPVAMQKEVDTLISNFNISWEKIQNLSPGSYNDIANKLLANLSGAIYVDKNNVYSRYLQLGLGNAPHPDPIIDKWIIDFAEYRFNITSRPVKTIFSDLISFRYRKKLTPSEETDLGIPPIYQFGYPYFNVIGPGDSGGVLLAELNGVKKIVGIIIGGSRPFRNRGYAMRIDRIMDRLDLAPWDGNTDSVQLSNKDNADYILREGVMDPPILNVNGKKYFQLNTVINALQDVGEESWHKDTTYVERIPFINPIYAPIQIQKILSSRYVSFTGPENQNSITVSNLNPGQSYKFRVSIDTGYGEGDSVITNNIT